ncbi:GNAT family N-acetyltransferase [Paenibacillus polymyxa]|uniref:HTH cro/C1-type domain-containing protein n=1 Tax=Paenibacillus polymyxa TaxID=1406 RepID=A0A378XWG2_PAEPO|nr:GNAT family N-acetyltransferase [Paenibacillus polymyxa]MBE7897179.1 GNAT family N-acetyltransferase [Paenibacillus polymyxa]MBG9763036.1 hypothetical protein [Paenibacillus polymyxa]MCC3257572.1 GNAT family N-acetyltransferase [Paenibacillus polymyxa]QPK51345.1 GNAT family N-acetyltransferase [Paenibacillus polymyxa]QPK56435.1 GNAT family N-acetyltransferase [Paenibacillus polymyxa]
MLIYDDISSKYIKDIEGLSFAQTPDEMSVENFLKEKALLLHELQTARTRLYFDDNDKLVGFFTLHNDLIAINPKQRDRLESLYGWTLPKDSDLTQFPSVKLHYLGVDTKYRKLGYGKYMVLEAIKIAADISELSGCNFLNVEALESTVEFYNKRGFKWLSNNGSLANMIFKLGEMDEPAYEPIQYDSETLNKMVSRLVKAWEELDLTHLAVANITKLEESDIEELEYGSSPNIETIKLISSALGVPMENLLK